MSLEFSPPTSADRFTDMKGVMACMNVCKIEQKKSLLLNLSFNTVCDLKVYQLPTKTTHMP